MKKMLMRPTAALFPAVLLAAALLGNAYDAASVFGMYIAIQLFSLCSVDAFRNAAAREPGVRRVDRRFSGAWPMILLGIAITATVDRLLYGKTDFLNGELWAIIAAGCIVIEQLFEERVFALSRRTDGVVLSVISNALLFLGLLLDGSGGVAAPVEIAGFYAICGAGLGMVISIAVNYVIEPMHAFSLVPRNIAFFPKAAAQSLAYPMTAVLWMARGNGEDLLAGMILWRLSRSVCRRSPDESRPLNLLLVTASAALTAASIWAPGLQMYALAAIAAMLWAAIVFCAPGWRLYAGAAMVIAAFDLQMETILPGMWNMAAVIVLCVAAVGLNLNKAFLRRV